MTGHTYAIAPALPLHQVVDEIVAKGRMATAHDCSSFVATDVASFLFHPYKGVNVLVGAYYGFKTPGVLRRMIETFVEHLSFSYGYKTALGDIAARYMTDMLQEFDRIPINNPSKWRNPDNVAALT